MKKKIIAIIIGCLALQNIVATVATDDNDNEKIKKKYIEKIEKYFNDVGVIDSDFIQENQDGVKSKGRLYWKKAKIMKMKYDPPHEKNITIKGNTITYYDRELDEKTETRIYSSPLAFLMKNKIDLKKNIKILAFLNFPNLLKITFCKNEDINNCENSVISLFFSKQPLSLCGWIIFKNKNDATYGAGTKIKFMKNKKITHQRVTSKKI